MFKKFLSIAILAALALALLPAGAVSANAGQPNFSGGVYGDGQLWGTKGAAGLPGPNGHNQQSFDKLFVFTNGASAQLPVSEAAPGNPAFNGGRWYTHTATWTAQGIASYAGDLPVLKSYGEILHQVSLGNLEVSAGSPEGGPPAYFECPLLPVK